MGRLKKYMQSGNDPLPELPRDWTLRQYFAKTFGEPYEPKKESVYTNIKKKKRKDRIKIFLSHPNRDETVRQRVHYLSDYLRDQKDGKFAPWCDKDYLGPSGRELNKELIHSMIQALEEADIVFIGLPAGPVSNWIISENHQAKVMKKRILIVSFGDAQIKKGMSCSKHAGYLKITPETKFWERVVTEEIEKNMSHSLEYVEF